MQNKLNSSLKLNLGCGSNKIAGCINIDAQPATNPDLVLDFCTSVLPYGDGEVSTIYCFHVIEHIQENSHAFFLKECWRVLGEGSSIYISYPEFTKCAQNYISNYQGKRDFWKATIYGRQSHPGDYHITLMDSDNFPDLLRQIGFRDIIVTSEAREAYNTVVRAVKGSQPPTYEQLLREKIWNVNSDNCIAS